jgi:NhaA family Na+:H+ antiporter
VAKKRIEQKRKTFTEPPIELILRPFQAFAKREASGGILLILCTVAALVWANSPWAGEYERLWHTEMRVGFGHFILAHPLHFWINDGLMVIFFFVVGLEIKRELLVGELASRGQAALPIAAALGGMLVPAGIYMALNAGGSGEAGWGIPMATDIAFAIGVLAILGKRVPLPLKVFLVALAIVDDIGAVLVIALFYTAEISWISLAAGGALLVVLAVLNLAGARNPLVYGLLGILLWLAFLRSGVHATISGVLVAMTIPARSRIDVNEFLSRGRAILDEFRRGNASSEATHSNGARQAAIESLETACEKVQTPMGRLERALHPWVTFVIMPVFALANAGVSLGWGDLSRALIHPVSLGVAIGLVLGKQIGITLFAWLAVIVGLSPKLNGVSWLQVYGAAWLGGIGFTMSLFIASLAFGNTPPLALAKVGILGASLISGLVGWLILYRASFRSAGA